MFKKHSGRRSAGPLFMIVRLLLSLTMFVVLLLGVYSAYKHFSGYDPLKLDPQAVLSNLIQAKSPDQVVSILSSLKLADKFSLTKQGESKDTKGINSVQTENVSSKPTGKIISRFLVFADSHGDNDNLKKAITQAKQKYPEIQFIIGLGDYSEVGTLDELKKAKSELDLSSLRYFLIPGDHDLWDSRDKSQEPLMNFRQVFGPSYQSFTSNGFRFILLNNADNYEGFDQQQLNWLDSELETAKEDNSKIIVFIHEPLFHPLSDHVMGRVEKSLKNQAKSLLFKLKEAGAKKILSGDIHYFSEYEEPETHLSLVTIGAVTIDRNPQTPRYGIVSIYENGEIRVEDVEIK